MASWNDYNDAQSNPNLIPKGTLAKVRLTIRPGGFDDPSQGWTGGYATRGGSGSVYLNGEFTVLEGPYAKRKIFTLIGLYSPKGPEWAGMGRSFLRGMLNSARGISDKNVSPQAQAARRISSFADLDGLEFVAKIEHGTDAGGETKNEIRMAVTPDHRDYVQVMGRQAELAGYAPTAQAYSPPVREAILAGLLDTDGHLTRGCFEIVSASRRMANDIAFIARSLGLRALITQRAINGTAYWRQCISGDSTCLPLRVVRKFPQPRRQKKDVLRTGFTLHDVGKGTYYGFTVDADHRYLLGDFTVSHNSGKTIMLSATIGERIGGGAAKAAVLAHRDELTAQNLAKFRRVNPGISTSVVDASNKSWGGQVTFAMVPTLTRQANLEAMPALDLLVIDEAHHAVADSYQRIVDRALHRNPMCRIYGVTATPNRGDRKGLRGVFSNVADQIRLGELVRSGHRRRSQPDRAGVFAGSSGRASPSWVASWMSTACPSAGRFPRASFGR